MTTKILKDALGSNFYVEGVGEGTEQDPFVPLNTTPVEYPRVFDESNMIAPMLLNGGSEHQAVNGSVTPFTFSYTPPTGYDFVCIRIIFYMEGTQSFNSNLFGDQQSLTNGWLIRTNGNDFMSAQNNRQLGSYMFDMNGVAIFGKEDKTMIGRFTFGKITSDGVGVVVKDGNSFETVVQDDLSGLTYLEARVEGVLIPVGELYPV